MWVSATVQGIGNGRILYVNLEMPAVDSIGVMTSSDKRSNAVAASHAATGILALTLRFSPRV